MKKGRNAPQGLTSPPPTPQARPMPGMAGGRMNRQDRMRYAELSKGDGRINRQDRRFMNQFEQQRSGQIPQGRPMPQRPPQPGPGQGQPPGGNLAGPVQGPQGPQQGYQPPSQWGQPSMPMPNNIGDYLGSHSVESGPSQFSRPAFYGGQMMGNQMMGGYGFNPMMAWQQYRNGGRNGGQGQ